MPTRTVHMTADAYVVCFTHALSTEKEEIMGLLIGEISPEQICYISAVILLRRSCKQADRVEISPEQLSDASTHAEMLSQKLNRPMRVVGWYHSHPHITVWPSHIDVRTQADWQMMDECFVGLIFSTFNHDKNSKVNRVQLSCFQSAQSMNDNWERVEVDLHITPMSIMTEVCIQSLADLLKILWMEEDEAYDQTMPLNQQQQNIMTRLYNGAVYTCGMVQINESMFRPVLDFIEQRQKNSIARLAELQEERKRLKKELKQITLSSPIGQETTC